eukprot:TRINITY_DN400_c4_g1_i1.p1 TRINITY_DN400_c4_g1~~TRINITY_DN400_c4_g1_i1.p1  ORF type:complete len:1087 (+),score=219.85 TRINITY_DN400_c4_g1_i1:43-3303(+)
MNVLLLVTAFGACPWDGVNVTYADALVNGLLPENRGKVLLGAVGHSVFDLVELKVPRGTSVVFLNTTARYSFGRIEVQKGGSLFIGGPQCSFNSLINITVTADIEVQSGGELYVRGRSPEPVWTTVIREQSVPNQAVFTVAEKVSWDTGFVLATLPNSYTLLYNWENVYNTQFLSLVSGDVGTNLTGLGTTFGKVAMLSRNIEISSFSTIRVHSEATAYFSAVGFADNVDTSVMGAVIHQFPGSTLSVLGCTFARVNGCVYSEDRNVHIANNVVLGVTGHCFVTKHGGTVQRNLITSLDSSRKFPESLPASAFLVLGGPEQAALTLTDNFVHRSRTGISVIDTYSGQPLIDSFNNVIEDSYIGVRVGGTLPPPYTTYFSQGNASAPLVHLNLNTVLTSVTVGFETAAPLVVQSFTAKHVDCLVAETNSVNIELHNGKLTNTYCMLAAPGCATVLNNMEVSNSTFRPRKNDEVGGLTAVVGNQLAFRMQNDLYPEKFSTVVSTETDSTISANIPTWWDAINCGYHNGYGRICQDTLPAVLRVESFPSPNTVARWGGPPVSLNAETFSGVDATAWHLSFAQPPLQSILYPVRVQNWILLSINYPSDAQLELTNKNGPLEKVLTVMELILCGQCYMFENSTLVVSPRVPYDEQPIVTVEKSTYTTDFVGAEHAITVKAHCGGVACAPVVSSVPLEMEKELERIGNTSAITGYTAMDTVCNEGKKRMMPSITSVLSCASACSMEECYGFVWNSNDKACEVFAQCDSYKSDNTSVHYKRAVQQKNKNYVIPAVSLAAAALFLCCCVLRLFSSFKDRHSYSESDDATEISLESFLPKTTWELKDLIGAGSYGTVYKATLEGVVVAVKILETHDSSELEVSTLEKLRHPNIMTYFKTIIKNTTVYLFMEYCEHGSVAALVTKIGKLPVPTVQLYTRQILEGVHHLHKNKILHRDIKGANVLITGNGQVKLSDFGCSKIVGDMQTTAAETVTGTPRWMAPEVITCDGKYSASADIWSVGCTVCEMMHGEPPWPNLSTPFAVMYHIANSDPSFPPDSHPMSTGFVLALLNRNPGARPTARQALEHEWLSHLPIAS